MEHAVLYIHGQSGGIEEAEHYRPLFEHSDVIGFDYRSQFPWEAKEEFPKLFDSVCGQYKFVTVIANSIGAYFAMHALSDERIKEAFFISPIVDMQKLIADMMTWANVREDDLREQGEIETSFGQVLSWNYLVYAKNHPITWNVPTHILYGSKDNLTAQDTITEFAQQTKATLAILEDGEHWFHTESQTKFLDDWIMSFHR